MDLLRCLTSWCWLLAGGIYSLLQRTLQKIAWELSGYGGWFHGEKMIWDGKAETPIISPIFYLLHRSAPFNVGRWDKRHEHEGVSITGTILKAGYCNFCLCFITTKTLFEYPQITRIINIKALETSCQILFIPIIALCPRLTFLKWHLVLFFFSDSPLPKFSC